MRKILFSIKNMFDDYTVRKTYKKELERFDQKAHHDIQMDILFNGLK